MSIALAKRRAIGAPQPRTTIRGLAERFLGEAALHPEREHQIYRQAAATFIGLAEDPQNARIAQRLGNIALDFAGAASFGMQPPTTDDFHEQLVERAQAYEEVGGESDMEMVARERDIHEARERGGPRLSIAPKSLKSAALGRVTTLKYQPNADDTLLGIVQQQTVAFWQGDKEEAQAVTVDVGVVAPPTLNQSAGPSFPHSIRPFGIVEYGSDGARTQVKFDFGMGVRLTVVGNYVSVLLGMDPPKPGQLAGTLSIGGSIGMFAAPSLAPVLLTAYVDLLGSGQTSDFIPRPAHAVQLLPPLLDAVAGTTTIDFFGLNGGSSPLYSVVFPTGTLGAVPIQLAGDVYFLKITNNTGATAAVSYRLPFQLSL